MPAILAALIFLGSSVLWVLFGIACVVALIAFVVYFVRVCAKGVRLDRARQDSVRVVARLLSPLSVVAPDGVAVGVRRGARVSVSRAALGDVEARVVVLSRPELSGWCSPALLAVV